MIRISAFIFVIFLSCNINFPKPSKTPDGTPEQTGQTSSLPLEKINLPKGFKIEVFAENVDNARSLCLTPNGTLFVGTRDKGKVYALRDIDGDFRVDKSYILAEDLNMPNGVAFKDGDLYVAEVSRVIKFENIEQNLANPPAPKIVIDDYPEERSHGWKYIAFGPDGKLYIPVGAPCNICDPEEEIYSTITRINSDGTGKEIVQKGIRNTVGFTWHPETGDLWFTDNGRDWLGDDSPACELNHAPKEGMHFGFPYCHEGDLPDPKFGEQRACAEFEKPIQKLGPHVAPLGMEFYNGAQFPAKYKHQALIAEHGSWNRTKPIGYRVTMVELGENGKSKGYTTFADGWLSEDGKERWGRPVDLEHLPDGSLLVSDDYADAIYRISYEGE